MLGIIWVLWVITFCNSNVEYYWLKNYYKNKIIMKKLEILGELPKSDTCKMSQCCWEIWCFDSPNILHEHDFHII